MSYLLLGFLTGLSLIFAFGAQNIFVIEQGLKKEFIFIVCLICSLSDIVLIFFGIFIFIFFQKLITPFIVLFLNILLIIFLIYFIWKKLNEKVFIINFNSKKNGNSLYSVIFKTLGFTYLNPHVYSDTVFFLGNFSKDFFIHQKILFGLGASFSSCIFFFTIGYLSQYLSKYLNTLRLRKIINLFIVGFIFFIIILVLNELIKSLLYFF